MKNKPVDTLTLSNRYSISSLTFLSQARARTMTRGATAINHDVDAVGISTLAAAHLSQVPQLRKKLNAGAGRHIELVVGGVVPPGDIPILERDGAAAVFLPGTKSTDAAMRLLDLLARRRNIS